MAKHKRGYHSFIWNKELINNVIVNSVVINIFNHGKPIQISAPAWGNHPILVTTDGEKADSYDKISTSNYSYAVTSSGIRKRLFDDSKYLHINLYVTKKFDFSCLEKDKDFLGKSYVCDAWKQYVAETSLEEYLQKSGFIACMQKATAEAGDDFEKTYRQLLKLAQKGSIDKAEEVMNSYNITCFYQAVFWKELYRVAR